VPDSFTFEVAGEGEEGGEDRSGAGEGEERENADVTLEQALGGTGVGLDALDQRKADVGEADDGTAEVDGGEEEGLVEGGEVGRIGPGGDGEGEHDTDADTEAGGEAEPHLPARAWSRRKFHHEAKQKKASMPG